MATVTSFHLMYRVAQKVSHYQVSSFSRIKNRHEDSIFHQF